MGESRGSLTSEMIPPSTGITAHDLERLPKKRAVMSVAPERIAGCPGGDVRSECAQIAENA